MEVSRKEISICFDGPDYARQHLREGRSEMINRSGLDSRAVVVLRLGISSAGRRSITRCARRSVKPGTLRNAQKCALTNARA